MRNAGDLEAASDLYPSFQSEGWRVAEELALPRTLKDRTGWATAVILTLLGVPRETVMEDYLFSNAYLHAKNEVILGQLARSSSPIKPEYLEAALTVRREYLESAFAEVERKYGSFDAYVRDGLGLSQADITALRGRYLTGVGA